MSYGVLLLALLCSCFPSGASQGLVLTFLGDGLEQLSVRPVQQALAELKVAAAFLPVKTTCSDGGECFLVGQVALNSISCEAFAGSTVPIGVKANATACAAAAASVDYEVRQGSADGPVLCRASQAPMAWKAAGALVYVAVQVQKETGGLRLSTNRVEIAPSEQCTFAPQCTEPVACLFASQAVANSLPAMLDSVLAALVPSVAHEVLPGVTLNLTMTPAPVVRQFNITLPFSGMFYESSGMAAPPFYCGAATTQGNAQGAALDMLSCFFDSLGAVLAARNALTLSYAEEWKDQSVNVTVGFFDAPTVVLLPHQFFLNVKFRLSLNALGEEVGFIKMGAQVPLHLSARNTLLMGDIPSNDIPHIQPSVDFSSYHWSAVAPSELAPIVIDFFGTTLLPDFSQGFLGAGINLPFPLTSDEPVVEKGFVEMAFDFQLARGLDESSR